MASAVLVQTNGLAALLCSLMYRVIAFSSWATDVNTARFKRRLVRIEKKFSTVARQANVSIRREGALSQEAENGVK